MKLKLEWDPKRLVPPAVMAGVSIGYMIMANGFGDDGSAQAPFLYGSALLGVSVLVFLLALVPGLKPAPKRTRLKHPEGPFPWRASSAIFGMIAGFIALVFLAGFYVAIPLFLFLFLKWVSRLSTVQALIFAAVAYAFTWGMFAHFLHLEVFTGYLGAHL